MTAAGIRILNTLPKLWSLSLSEVEVTAAEVLELEQSMGWIIHPRDADERDKLWKLHRDSPE